MLSALAMLLSGCTSGDDAPRPLAVTAAPATGSPAAALPGALGEQQMEGLLLQGEDLPGLTLRRSVDSTVELTSSPQLALCRQPGPALPHQVANVLAKGTAPGQAQVFQVVSVYADPAAARQAWDYDVGSVRACPTFRSGDVTFTVQEATDLPTPAGGAAMQYRVAASNVVSGDVRTLAVLGRATVLISSYGTPTDGSPLTAYQATVAGRALARLPAP